ncbi:hypothetical protein VCHA53O466_40160 [Vibrio chagasii]|nr:hypothetical protein VCHA53O466_40160 [Vibrio chagasii]
MTWSSIGMDMKNNHFYSAMMIENGNREFVVFRYSCATYHVTGRTPFSIDQKNVHFEQVVCLGDEDLLCTNFK